MTATSVFSPLVWEEAFVIWEDSVPKPEQGKTK